MTTSVKLSVPGERPSTDMLSARVSAGDMRRPDRRRKFVFVHELELSRAVTESIEATSRLRLATKVQVSVDGRIDVDDDGVPELSSHATATRILRPRRHSVCRRPDERGPRATIAVRRHSDDDRRAEERDDDPTAGLHLADEVERPRPPRFGYGVLREDLERCPAGEDRHGARHRASQPERRHRGAQGDAERRRRGAARRRPGPAGGPRDGRLGHRWLRLLQRRLADAVPLAVRMQTGRRSPRRRLLLELDRDQERAEGSSLRLRLRPLQQRLLGGAVGERVRRHQLQELRGERIGTGQLGPRRQPLRHDPEDRVRRPRLHPDDDRRQPDPRQHPVRRRADGVRARIGHLRRLRRSVSKKPSKASTCAPN